MRFLLQAAVLALSAALFNSFADPIRDLPALNIDIKETSVSGISSGGFMAVQLAVAYSSIIKGAGIVAAGPYYCSQGSRVTATTKCSCTAEPVLSCAVTAASTDVPGLISTTQSFFANHLIDDPANIAHQRVMTFVGREDHTVPPMVVKQLEEFYSAAGLPQANLLRFVQKNAGHTMPTVSYGGACGVSESPFIGRGGFDGAKEILSWIYGPASLKPAVEDRDLERKYIQFDQSPFIPREGLNGLLWRNGMDSTGWVYMPDSCRNGARCRLHIVLHGCKQGQDYLPLTPPPGGGLFNGTTFVKHTGYARWAESNQIVVLFPQAISIPNDNPNGCWDWWGFTNEHFADNKGVQMRAIRAMIDRLTSGHSH